jgi:hypothetical protein
MSDTITVISPPTGYEPKGYGGGLMGPSRSHHTPNSGQLLLQVTLPYYQSTKFIDSTLAWLANYVKKHGASDPLTIQIVTNHIRFFLNADGNLCRYPRLSVYHAYHSQLSKVSPPPTKYNYQSMSIKQMSGNVVTPAAAFGHYLWGNGEPRYVNLRDVGLKVTPDQIPELMRIVNSGVTGKIPVSIRFPHDTYSSGGMVPAAYLGNVTLHTQGTINIQPGGAWSYNGVVRAYDDKFDFNLGNFRGPIAESLTYLGASFSGTPYIISMPGQINISGSGHR